MRGQRDGAEEEPPEFDPRPVVPFLRSRGHEAVEAAIDALRSDSDLYKRANALVHVIGAPEPAEGRAPLVSPGTPIIRPMAVSTLWERASRAARWEKEDRRSKSGMSTCDPPAPVLAAIMTRGSYPGVPELLGILEAPALRPDYTLAFGAGYDAPTKFLLCPSIDFEPPPAHPTHGEAARALGELREVFDDFPHVSDASRMVPVALILTLLARPAIQGSVPAFGFDAATRASGKTRQVDAATMVALGRPAPPLNYPAEDEELEKVMGALALAAPAVVKFDNVTCRFGGGPIDRVLTAGDTTTFRVLGRSETPELPWRSVVAYTGNNLELRGDTSRRSLICRLESPLENPELRPETDFAHPDLLPWVAAHRVRLVKAGLTVLRGWACAGAPRMTCKTWGGGFEAWSAIVPPAIVWAGGADPMGARPVVTGDEEPEKAALSVILAGIARLDAAGAGMSSRAIVDALWTRDRLRGEASPDGYEDMREAIEAIVPTRAGNAPSTKTLGERLGHLGKGRVVAGMRLEKSTGHGGTNRWRAVAVKRQ